MKKPIKLFRSIAKEKEYLRHYDEALVQLPISYHTQYVQTTFGNTHIIHTGLNGNPKLVLLHCQGFSSISWYCNLKQLSQHFEIYCIDSIGEPGRTESNRTKISNSDYVEWLLAVFDALALTKPHIAGWSFGGFIATMFTLHYPRRVNRLVVMSPAGCIAPVSSGFFIRLFPALLTGSEVKINRFLKWISGKDNDDFPNPAFTLFTCGMKYFQGWARGAKLIVYTEEDFQKIKTPVLFLLGENDPIYKKTSPQKLVAKLNQLRPNIMAETVPGSHGFPILNADLVNERMISFLV